MPELYVNNIPHRFRPVLHQGLYLAFVLWMSQSVVLSFCFVAGLGMSCECFGSCGVLGTWLFSLGEDYAALSCLVSDNAAIIIFCGWEFSVARPS